MTKIKVEKKFSYGGEDYEPGDTADVPQDVAKELEKKGAGAEIHEEEGPEIEKLEIGGAEEETQTAAQDEGEIYGSMDEDFEAAGTLPERFNAKAASNKVEELAREPPVNPLKGRIVQTGKAQYGPFVIIKERGTGNEYTVFDQTSLKAFVHTAKEIYDPGKTLYAGARFDGIMEKKGKGRNYLAYSAVLRNENGKKIRLQEPEEETEG